MHAVGAIDETPTPFPAFGFEDRHDSEGHHALWLTVGLAQRIAVGIKVDAGAPSVGA